jgi:hypothetical protein
MSTRHPGTCTPSPTHPCQRQSESQTTAKLSTASSHLPTPTELATSSHEHLRPPVHLPSPAEIATSYRWHLPISHRRSRATNPPSRITPPPSISGARNKSPITDNSTSQHQRSTQRIPHHGKTPPPSNSGARDKSPITDSSTSQHQQSMRKILASPSRITHLPASAERATNAGQPITYTSTYQHQRSMRQNPDCAISARCSLNGQPITDSSTSQHQRSTRQNPMASPRPAHHG